jgi:RNA polymerase sigma-70 factor (ECF subfamily)
MSRISNPRVGLHVDRDSERALVARLRQGDDQALAQVYGLMRPRVFSFLARLSCRRDVAEDLLHETFLRLARKAPTLREDTRVASWLFTVARNLFVSHWRHARLDRDWLDGAADEQPAAEWVSPFDLCSAGETQRRLERALATLSPALREVVLLVAVERMDASEVAGVMGITVEAVRQRLSRGRAILARHMAATGSGEVEP